jgi:hypothetical protein
MKPVTHRLMFVRPFALGPLSVSWKRRIKACPPSSGVLQDDWEIQSPPLLPHFPSTHGLTGKDGVARAHTPTVRPCWLLEGGEEEAPGPTARRSFIYTPPLHRSRGTGGGVSRRRAASPPQEQGKWKGAPPVQGRSRGRRRCQLRRWEGEDPNMGRAAVEASSSPGSTCRQSSFSAPPPAHAPPAELPKMEPPCPHGRGWGEVGAEELRVATRLAGGGVRHRS